MWSTGLRWVFAAAVVAGGLAGCGGGGGGKSGGSPDGGSQPDGAGATIGANDGGDDGGDNPQVLPPYLGRIVLSPAALLFTDAGQSASLRAQAYDAAGAPMDAVFTWTSSQPDQVAVDSNGNVTSMVPVGSTQITAAGAGLTSQPLLVIVVQPKPGTVLVSDAQVVAGPAQVDPTADPIPGAQFQVTLDGVGALAAGTMLVSREGNAVAGTVVSTQPNGTHTDVVYELPTLQDLFTRFDFKAGYDYDLQMAADDDAIAALVKATGAAPGLSERRSSLDVDIGPLKCKADISPVGITFSQSLKFTPTLHFEADFADDENGDLTNALMLVTGNVQVEGKLTAKIAPGAVASLSCKYEFREFVLPLAGPLSALVAPRVSIGAKASIKATATTGSIELGGKMEESADFNLGFSAGTNGTGDIATFNLGDAHLEPMFSINKDVQPPALETSASLGPYVSLSVTFLKFGLADAFVGAKLKYTMMEVSNQVGSNTPNKYELKAPVLEVGPGSAINKALSFLGGLVSFSTTITTEGPVIASSPTGMFTADNQGVDVPANKPITFTATLDPMTTSFLGIENVSGLHIFRVDVPLIMEPLNEVKYINGPGPTYTWTWTPTVADEGTHLFIAGFDDELVYSLDVIGVTAPFWTPNAIQINVGQPAGNWGGTSTVSFMGTGPTSAGGQSTVMGSEQITWVPGMPSPDGVSFDMVATSATLTYSEMDVDSSNLGVCPATETYTVSSTIMLTGSDLDLQARGGLTVIPQGVGAPMADYTSGIPDLYGTAPSSSDIVSDCGTSMHNEGIANIAMPGNGALLMGTIKSDADTITGSTTYTASGPYDIPVTLNASWSFHKM